MTLSTTNSRFSYAGNGVSTVFAFPAYFLNAADLVVALTDNTTGLSTPQVLTTNYTVTGAGVSTGGSVTMLVAPPTGKTLVIYRDPALTQDLDLVENDKMPAEEIEKRFDKVTMLIQRARDLLSRSITLGDGYSGSFSPFLPAVLNPLQFLRINNTGTGFDTSDIASAGVVGLPGAPGMAAYLGSNNFIARTLSAGAGIAVSNGDGQAGNPTIALGPDAKDLVIASKIANFTLTTEDAAFGDTSGGAFTFTLPPATRKAALRIQKTDSSFTALTVQRAGSDNIILPTSGTSTTLNTQGESILLIPDGVSKWYLVNRDYPKGANSFVMSITGSVSNPTKGTVTEKAYWSRVGAFMHIQYTLIQTVAGTAGSGDYYFNLPGGLSADGNIVTANSDFASAYLGAGHVFASGLSSGIPIRVSTGPTLSVMTLERQDGGQVASTGYDLGNGTTRYLFQARVPISGWNT